MRCPPRGSSRLRPGEAGSAAPAGEGGDKELAVISGFILQNRGRMNNTSPFLFLESVAARFKPPDWMVDEGQRRLVLFLNHVLMQEKAAQDRLLRQKGKIAQVRWGLFAIDLVVTPAGLLDRAAASCTPDLVISVVAESPTLVVESVLSGKAPPVQIAGDVQLAAEINWLAENLRWDVEEDLARVIGDAPAHALAGTAGRIASGLKRFLGRTPFASASPVPASASGTRE